MSNQKKKNSLKKVVIFTVILAVLAAGTSFAASWLTEYRSTRLAAMQAEVEAANKEANDAYQVELAQYRQETASGVNQAWPAQKTEGWDIVDLSTYPLEDTVQVSANRTELMHNGMLLVNQWHSRPEDFDETELVSVGTYTSGKVQVKDYNVKLFPVAIDAMTAALNDAAQEGFTTYLVQEGYRSYDEQNNMFQAKMNKLSSKYEGEELLEQAKKEVNYPGTSEFNTGLSFLLRLYSKTDANVGKTTFSTSEEGTWFSEHCWEYGLVSRFPLADFPLPGTVDKSFKTGIGSKLNLYRYVGKGNAAVMHELDLCLEEYIEYLGEHPHIAVFKDGVLKYEIFREYVGDDDLVYYHVTNKTGVSETSLDNMGYVVSVFAY